MFNSKFSQYALLSLAVIFITGFFTTILMMFQYPEFKSTLDILAGAMSSSVVTIIGYFYGSSAGSKQKTDLLNKDKEIQ